MATPGPVPYASSAPAWPRWPPGDRACRLYGVGRWHPVGCHRPPRSRRRRECSGLLVRDLALGVDGRHDVEGVGGVLGVAQRAVHRLARAVHEHGVPAGVAGALDGEAEDALRLLAELVLQLRDDDQRVAQLDVDVPLVVLLLHGEPGRLAVGLRGAGELVTGLDVAIRTGDAGGGHPRLLLGQRRDRLLELGGVQRLAAEEEHGTDDETGHQNDGADDHPDDQTGPPSPRRGRRRIPGRWDRWWSVLRWSVLRWAVLLGSPRRGDLLRGLLLRGLLLWRPRRWGGDGGRRRDLLGHGSSSGAGQTHSGGGHFRTTWYRLVADWR